MKTALYTRARVLEGVLTVIIFPLSIIILLLSVIAENCRNNAFTSKTGYAFSGLFYARFIHSIFLRFDQ